MIVGGCFEQNKSYLNGALKRNGKNVVIKNVNSPEACQSECKKDTDCKFWTWGGPTVNSKKKRNQCLIKDKKGTLQKDSQESKGKVSGPKTCPGKYFNQY